MEKKIISSTHQNESVQTELKEDLKNLRVKNLIYLEYERASSKWRILQKTS
jgi:hypothetical protein